MKIIRRIVLFLFVAAVAAGAFFYFSKESYFSEGEARSRSEFEIVRGENALAVGERLQTSGLIPSKYYFVYYLWKIDKLHSLIAAKYQIEPNLTTAEVAAIVTTRTVSDNRIKLTFPEGWNTEQMARRLGENGLPADAFLKIIQNPSADFLAKYDFLNDLERGSSLEGYLFPDTYFFAKDASAEDIVGKMLDNFSTRVTSEMRQEIADKNQKLPEVVTLASIIQKEVVSDNDMKLVSGIFLNRLASGQPLQSCATLAFVLGETKKQYSIADTKIASPYNTYENKGLTPGPICNPGINAINAAIHPESTAFNYFLSDPATGKTVFSETFDQHVANKAKYGL